MINVLVVDDSAVARSLIIHILDSDPELCVTGTASNGEEALKAVEQIHPDVITMDISMPQMDGLEATRQIMETRPTPIVIVSGLLDNGNTAVAYEALAAGALAVQARPCGPGHADYTAKANDLVRLVKLMSEVKVVRRWARLRGTMTGPIGADRELTGPFTTRLLAPANDAVAARPTDLAARATPGTIKLVVVGASTGGPPVLRTILSDLPRDLSVPVVIVQHIAAGFTRGFAEWLAETSKYPVLIPMEGDVFLSGKAYVALDGMHLGIGPGNRAILSSAPPEHGMRPAVSYLFRSVAECMGRNVLGVLLTGMGKDGAIELKALHDIGAITIAQDAESSVVHGMPGVAIGLGGATYVRPGDKIGGLIASLVKQSL